jgi:FMN reductase
MSRSILVVAVGGTLRAESSTEKVLKAVLADVAAKGARVQLFSGASLNFPMYAPGVAATEAVGSFVSSLRSADAIVLGSPGYHGGISGLVKNAIDYTEELAADTVPYFTNKPVGCVATGLGWQGCNTTLQALRNVVHSLRGWPTPLGIALNTKEPSFDSSGGCINRELGFQIGLMADQLMAGARELSEA